MAEPGIYTDISEEDYHKDPSDIPSLSSSIAKIIWEKSPKHAWLAHPKLNPDYEPKNKTQFDIGNAAHAHLLEGDGLKIVVIDASDYRKKETQEKRDALYALGKVPVLSKDWINVKEMADVAKGFIAETELAGIFDNGKPEQTLIADYEGAMLRSRLDWLANDRLIILDYKSTGGSSKPEQWIRRQLFNMNYDIQVYHYPLMNELTGGPPNAKFIFLVQENTKPYACSLVGAGPSVIDSGKKKFRYALHKWKWCLEFNKWPAYDTRIAWADVPPWQMAEVEERGTDE
uniref:PD-(D/E)XK nuclease-like domain-containing protein n=1 Tax=Candidatus Desulfatibia profunda TaxID=2841695 RepID=A0A8J6NJX8_9BACT|nr:PD-(D/E)XK nuclease-like domain-containing protein [Candidatus Desulfatibia profunda]